VPRCQRECVHPKTSSPTGRRHSDECVIPTGAAFQAKRGISRASPQLKRKSCRAAHASTSTRKLPAQLEGAIAMNASSRPEPPFRRREGSRAHLLRCRPLTTQEIGTRVALGATREQVMREMFDDMRARALGPRTRSQPGSRPVSAQLNQTTRSGDRRAMYTMRERSGPSPESRIAKSHRPTRQLDRHTPSFS
jgi:hypothetical protein